MLKASFLMLKASFLMLKASFLMLKASWITFTRNSYVFDVKLNFLKRVF
jgi:hypothetical protein